ncbi:hypothetical protein PENARI_c004G05336 [Penicillium arizonense]|uniref:Retrotransposon gag domain-containing protein n=1 Tax=Penicillium arizonense TaxID=1835702 RepID=A0A1F5LQH2_PENAI|nr:hypothetical protein PENARI_c004G05336 [Penicillium arizonense]OGE55452.1 hypothetical protein PENARI_c004G05336 [Penicillium arizonense]
MPAFFEVRPFHGHRDGYEDPRDFIEDIEIATRRDYASQIAANPALKRVQKPETLSEEQREIYNEMQQVSRLLFRQGIRGRAEAWYIRLDRSVKQDWDLLKNACLTGFALPEESQFASIARMEELYDATKQGRDEKITTYLERADDFHAQYGPQKPYFGWKVVSGLTDQQKTSIILFHMRQEKTIDYPSARQMIVHAYAGANNPF